MEHDRLLKEIRIIDKWCNYGANNGLFYKKLNRNYNDKLDRADENGSIDKKQSDPEVDREKLYE